jgi:hypothetical protein
LNFSKVCAKGGVHFSKGCANSQAWLLAKKCPQSRSPVSFLRILTVAAGVFKHLDTPKANDVKHR